MTNSSRRFLGICFRLSLVTGLGCAGLDAYRVFEAHQAEEVRISKTRSSMECALRIPDLQLAPKINGFGNVDVVAFGCLPGTDGKTYFTNRWEIDEYRTNPAVFLTNRSTPIDPVSNGYRFLTGMLAVNAAALALLAAYKTLRWVALGSRLTS